MLLQKAMALVENQSSTNGPVRSTLSSFFKVSFVGKKDDNGSSVEIVAEPPG